MHATIAPQSNFQEAAQLWIDSRTFGDGHQRHKYVGARTLDGLKDHVKMLNRFFSSLPLQDIHVGHLCQYQRQRADGTIGNSGPNNINKETAVMIRILKRAHLWTPEMAECFEPLQREESEIGMALTEAQQQRLLDTQFDSCRPMSETGMKKPWEEAREAAGLKWFRPNDLRHTAITRMAEAGTPMAIIESMAGHMGLKMQRHYTHVGEIAKRRALETTFGKKPMGVHSFTQGATQNKA